MSVDRIDLVATLVKRAELLGWHCQRAESSELEVTVTFLSDDGYAEWQRRATSTAARGRQTLTDTKPQSR